MGRGQHPAKCLMAGNQPPTACPALPTVLFCTATLLSSLSIKKQGDRKRPWRKTGHPQNRPRRAKCIHSFAQAKRGNRGKPHAFKALILLDFVETSTRFENHPQTNRWRKSLARQGFQASSTISGGFLVCGERWADAGAGWKVACRPEQSFGSESTMAVFDKKIPSMYLANRGQFTVNEKSLFEHIGYHFSLHFVKRLAYIDENGFPPESILANPRHMYVQEASHRLTLLHAAIDDAKGLITQVANPPPDDWLSSVGLTRDKYVQQLVDLFTLLLHSTADRALLLTNAILRLEIEPRKLNLKEISKKLQGQGEIIAALRSVHSCIAHLSDPRNQFAHRGESRYIGQFSDVVRMKVILKEFECPSDQVRFADLEALQRLKADMLSELISVKTVVGQVVGHLLQSYLTQIESLGGPDTPNADEIAHSKAALAYFRGGPRPAFMGTSNQPTNTDAAR